MPNLHGKDISELYPLPKSYDELRAEREAQDVARRPRFVATKFAVWTASGVATVFIAYRFVDLVLQGGMSSAVTALASASFSIFIGIVATVIIRYFYSLISKLALITVASTGLFYTCLVVIFIVSSLLLKFLLDSGWSYYASVVVGSLVACALMFAVSKYIAKDY